MVRPVGFEPTAFGFVGHTQQKQIFLMNLTLRHNLNKGNKILSSGVSVIVGDFLGFPMTHGHNYGHKFRGG
jgi:hypothetical protein